MIIKEVRIENFRCYYGENTIKFNNGLNLVIGDNGDGKTTFFEALEWLFNTTTFNSEPRLISQKKRAEIHTDEIATVKVSITFEHDGIKSIEKSFDFKIENNKVSTFNSKFIGFEEGDFDRIPTGGGAELLDRCFDAAIRKYSLFKGESQLNIFNKAEAMQYLIQTFSNVRDFDPYLLFTEFASEEAQKIFQRTIRTNKKNADKERKISANIEFSKNELNEKKKRLETIKKEVGEYESKINDYKRNDNASKALNIINSRITSLKEEQIKTKVKIKENYPIRLLDEQWILCGFSSILDEFNKKISDASKSKRKIEKEANKAEGKREIVKEINVSLAKGIYPLPITIPDKETMEEMLDDQFCKVCGRPALKGTEAYSFMQSKVDELIRSNNHYEETPEKQIFPNNFINELEQKRVGFSFDKKELNNLKRTIEEDIMFNKKMKEKESKIKNSIEIEEENKMKLLAQTDNLSEEQLQNVFHSLMNWWRHKNEGDKEIPTLENEIRIIQNKLDDFNKEYNLLAINSSANIFSRINTAFLKIKDSFINAKKINTQDFLNQLQEKSNEYLDKLNIDDFMGVINIKENYNGGAEIELCDNQRQRIYDPNTALETTMYMSVLFAISELTTLKRENDYPLIFDAPTSSFSDAKEIDFFNVIAEVDKQCIIFTKSFLKADKISGRNILDVEEIDKLNGKVYRIAKKRPFDDTDLSTIEMLISEIKE